MKPQVGKSTPSEAPAKQELPPFRTTSWRPVSFFGEGLAKRKARRVYERRGGIHAMGAAFVLKGPMIKPS
tara:strand:- start:120 stop:329 length:210 start_codon:yes stop_codon:yes gene_type:complete